MILTTQQLNEFYNNHGFAPFGFDDLQFIQDYFKSENRNPPETETKSFGYVLERSLSSYYF